MAAPTQERPARHEYEFTVIIEQDEDGVYIAHCPALPGCHSDGDTLEEALVMIEDAITLYLDHFRECGTPIPPDVKTATVQILL